MSVLSSLEPKRVFEYFEQISAVPHGSGNMEAIAQYCMDFAKCHSLKAVRDGANNVVIFKPATAGYENSEPIILQGHLDMVCQKQTDCDIDFEKDGLWLYAEDDFIKAKGTTLGADNAVAVAMIMAILESSDIPHPAIEAVFTTDEEIGMIGATQLDTAILSGKRMINLDSEDMDTVTVSCAGGSEFKATVPVTRQQFVGTEILVVIKGLKGGHSGIEINSGRVNANILAARFLNYMNTQAEFEIIRIDGGDKGNAIPLCCEIRLCSKDAEGFKKTAESYFEIIKTEISKREDGFEFDITPCGKGEYSVIDTALKDKLIFALLCTPNGVIDMSAEIEGLVETSLNLGILKTLQSEIIFHFALRSNKKSALYFLEQKLEIFFTCIPCKTETSGYYPPWEFNGNSQMQRLYKEIFKQQFGYDAKVEAIHAGLECGVFADKIEGLDCISIGPQLYDVHTTGERLSISSTQEIYKLLLKILEECR